MKKILILLFFIPAFGFSQNAKKLERIDSVLTYLNQRQLFNGSSLSVGEKGKILYKKAFGISNPQTIEPLSCTNYLLSILPRCQNSFTP
ncbi:MAG: hypothetical protein U5K54_28340 [Cytophagales bacterium]|nr:hypothetical protein [Cytophagales bacterium]